MIIFLEIAFILLKSILTKKYNFHGLMLLNKY